MYTGLKFGGSDAAVVLNMLIIYICTHIYTHVSHGVICLHAFWQFDCGRVLNPRAQMLLWCLCI